MIDETGREREDIETLLPWYEKGMLAPGEMRRVERYLAAHPEMQTQLVLIREELNETIAANERLGMPSSNARDRLMARIAAEASAATRSLPKAGSWWAHLLPEGWSPALGVAAAAACLIIIVQAAALISLGSGGGHEGGDYQVASGENSAPAGAGTFVLIRFADNASAGDIAALLQSIGATIVDGPKPGGAFKLRISSRTLSADGRDAIIAKLRQKSDIVAFVTPAG